MTAIHMKYHSIPYLEEDRHILKTPVDVFEKLDGGNCQIQAGLGRLFLASRSGDHSQRTHKHQWFGQFQTWANRFYAQQQHELHATLDELLPSHLVLFGEWLSPHTIPYRAEAVNQFYLIDVYDQLEERFLPYEEGVARATIDTLLPLRTLRTLGHGKFTTKTLEEFLPGSDYRDGDKEGIVIKDYENQRFAKLVTKKFQEKREGVKGLAAYLTPQRLRKCTLKLQNIEGRTPTPRELYNEFYRDVVKEAPLNVIKPEQIEVWFQRQTGTVLSEQR